jgi:hypothetical protein
MVKDALQFRPEWGAGTLCWGLLCSVPLSSLQPRMHGHSVRDLGPLILDSRSQILYPRTWILDLGCWMLYLGSCDTNKSS